MSGQKTRAEVVAEMQALRSAWAEAVKSTPWLDVEALLQAGGALDAFVERFLAAAPEAEQIARDAERYRAFDTVPVSPADEPWRVVEASMRGDLGDDNLSRVARNILHALRRAGFSVERAAALPNRPMRSDAYFVEMVRQGTARQTALMQDEDLWQAACEVELQSCLEWQEARLVGSAAPFAVALGGLSISAALMEAVSDPYERKAAKETALKIVAGAFEAPQHD
jgi:hypothetical protein